MTGVNDGKSRPPASFYFLAQVYHEVASVIGWEKAISFGMAVWREKRPPSQRRAEFARESGGGRGVIYVPSEIKEGRGTELVRLAGKEDAELLVERFGGMLLFFPSIEQASKKSRNDAILAASKAGTRKDIIAASFGMTVRNVHRIAGTGSATE